MKIYCKVLEKTLEVTKNRLSSCGNNLIIEKNVPMKLNPFANKKKSVNEDAI